jgi:flavin reductase (DIM6/NTAB) family NADH-FMN oxidoreductase RutF
MTFSEGMLRNTLGIFPTGAAVVTARGSEGTLQGVTTNFLQEDQQDLSVRFNKALSNKWEHVTSKTGIAGAPVILPALAVLECRPYDQFDGEDHVIIVGRVEHVE